MRVCHCEPVVLRAANQNSNDCQWQSYLNVAHAGVAPSRDSLRSQSPGDSGNCRRSAKAPLADQGELSRASPASTRLRGSELSYFDNPSVKNQRFLPAPFTQGSRGCSRTSTLSTVLRKSVATSSARPAPIHYCAIATARILSNCPEGTPELFIFHHSLCVKTKAGAVRKAPRPLALSQPPK